MSAESTIDELDTLESRVQERQDELRLSVQALKVRFDLPAQARAKAARAQVQLQTTTHELDPWLRESPMVRSSLMLTPTARTVVVTVAAGGVTAQARAVTRHP